MIKTITFKIDRWVSFDTIHFEQDNLCVGSAVIDTYLSSIVESEILKRLLTESIDIPSSEVLPAIQTELENMEEHRSEYEQRDTSEFGCMFNSLKETLLSLHSLCIQYKQSTICS